MRKTFLIALGSALLAAASLQSAAATERHHAKPAHAAANTAVSRAYAAWPAPQVDTSRYSGGYSAPAGH
jgi:hypothetical protein